MTRSPCFLGQEAARPGGAPLGAAAAGVLPGPALHVHRRWERGGADLLPHRRSVLPRPATHAILIQLKARSRCLRVFGWLWACLGVVLSRDLPFRRLSLTASSLFVLPAVVCCSAFVFWGPLDEARLKAGVHPCILVFRPCGCVAWFALCSLGFLETYG